MSAPPAIRSVHSPMFFPRTPTRATRAIAHTLAVLLLTPVLTVLVQAPAPAADAAVAMQLTATEATQLKRLNDYRAAHGLGPLHIDPMTQQQARAWTKSMSARRTLSHSPHSASECRAASPNCSAWAENVGYSSSGEASVFTALTRSSGHAANMRRSNVDRVGIGAFTDSSGITWVTQRFIKCSCSNDATASAANEKRARDQRFVSSLFDDFLFRAPSAGESQFFTDALTYDMPESTLVSLFAGSDEWVGALIDELYRSTLGRPSDPGGRRHWIDVYNRGTSPAAIAAQFYASQEFFQRSGGTNRAWVDQLYVQIMARRGDSGGVAHWTRQADRGVSRASIAHSFYQSPESRQTRVISLYQTLLSRNPDSGGLAHWTEVLSDGHDVRLAATLASSPEYRANAG